MKDFIDYSIIWKFIHSNLDEEEKNELDRWLEADTGHRAYFEKAVQDAKNKTITESTSVNKNPKTVQTFISVKKSFRQKTIYLGKVAALVLLIVSAGYGVFILNKNPEKELNLSEISFDPGIQKATLVLNNGEQLDLEAGKDTLLLQKETEIRNSGSKLQYQTFSKNKQFPEEEAIQYNTLLVPRGGEYTLVLSDETKVHLNSESILKFPVNFTGDVREVHLKGEAYFEVKTDASRPFIVNTGSVITKVFGTSFNVNSYPEKDLITTTLVEGNVTISKVGANAAEVQLLPGEQGNFSKTGETIQKTKVDISEYTAWKDGRFVFRDKTLQEITDILGRWYDVDFVFENRDISTIRFTGNLKRYENIQQILSKISKTNEIKFTAYEKTIYLN